MKTRRVLLLNLQSKERAKVCATVTEVECFVHGLKDKNVSQHSVQNSVHTTIVRLRAQGDDGCVTE